MGFQELFWIYLFNAVLLIDHEIDSAYWQEWKLFKIPEQYGISSFLILHLPLLLLILWGLILIRDGSTWGLILSIVLSAGGLFAFIFHYYHLRRGRVEFDTIISRALLVSTLLVSLIQMPVSVWLLIK